MTLGVDLGVFLASLGVVAQLFLIDLLLSADNALLIAMAVRSLPEREMRTGAVLGTVGAIGLRVAMAAVVTFLLDVPYLKLVAGVLLLGVALRLTLERGDSETLSALDGRRVPWRGSGLLGAVVAIMVADAVMSLDNVVAIAAVADGSLLLLGFGLALSIPLLVYGSAVIRRFLGDNGGLVLLAGMFLGWIAGVIAASDPSIVPWVAESAPALTITAPAACALFVLWESRILAPVADRGKA